MKGKHPRMRNFGFSMNIDRHGMSQLGQPAHGSRMYDNSAMEHLMRTVELMMKFREAKFDVVEAGLAANSERFAMTMQPSEVEFDIRLPPAVDPELIRKRIAEKWAPS